MIHRRQRGSALVLSVVAVLIITVIAIGIVRFASREVAGATAGARQQALSACAESARQLLMSKFHSLGIQPAAITALNVPMDGPGGATRAMGGHIDSMNITVGQVSYLPDSAFGPTDAVRDQTSIVALVGQGGKPMKVVVHCQDHGDGTATTGRQLEVEFGVRFGL